MKKELEELYSKRKELEERIDKAVQLLENYEKIQIIYTVDAKIVLRAIEKAGIYNPQNY